MANLRVFTPVFYAVVDQPEDFLGVQEGVNYFGQGVAILIGYFVTLPYAIAKLLRFQSVGSGS